MSLVKKEAGSTTESPNWSPAANQDKHAPNHHPNNSRPPLKQKTENVPTSTASDIDSKKQLLSKYLIGANETETVLVKKEPGSSSGHLSPLRIKSHLSKKKIGKPVHTEKPTDKGHLTSIGQGVQLADSSCTLQLIDPKTVKVGAGKNGNSSPIGHKPNATIEKVPRYPGKYEELKLRLNEPDVSESAAFYEEVFSRAEWKQECIQLARCDMSQWVLKGQDILKEQHALMCRMIQARIKLSHRFQVVTDIINERASLLMQEGDVLGEKLKKVQHLGREILDLL
ncbi:unnamed protein product [Kluyveromyces dobzhanskii CBS 2104]|uniref:WGS project CCBQ000000000 data, contig 00105 n=1 Tax=Kluyveromyces dobzhanskii CBS 2104 TaxID=1427455 RepID=A0A0A8L1J8_9SACH|nr:unnamed protein product [Kluyveromyces dobzhanskii CBS 2104]